MEEYLSYAPYAAAVLVLIGVIGLIWSRRSKPQKVEDLPCEVVSDWRPTGKIDFARRDINGKPRDIDGKPDGSLFCLQTEEYRLLQSMSGTKHVEVRWRVATLEDDIGALRQTLLQVRAALARADNDSQVPKRRRAGSLPAR